MFSGLALEFLFDQVIFCSSLSSWAPHCDNYEDDIYCALLYFKADNIGLNDNSICLTRQKSSPWCVLMQKQIILVGSFITNNIFNIKVYCMLPCTHNVSHSLPKYVIRELNPSPYHHMYLLPWTYDTESLCPRWNVLWIFLKIELEVDGQTEDTRANGGISTKTF